MPCSVSGFAWASDPGTMGWMRGFPPAPDKQIRFTDPDYFAFPKLRWTACHFRELMPTVSVRRGTGAATALPRNLDPTLDAVSFKPGNGGDRMTWRQAFDANHSDGILVLHHGRIVYERHAGCLGDDTLHGAMSVTKSLTCLLGEMLVAEGRLNEIALVAGLIPELKHSAFGDATVRPSPAFATAATAQPLPRLATARCRAGRIAPCGGSATTPTARLPRAACTGRRSGSIRQPTW